MNNDSLDITLQSQIEVFSLKLLAFLFKSYCLLTEYEVLGGSTAIIACQLTLITIQIAIAITIW